MAKDSTEQELHNSSEACWWIFDSSGITVLLLTVRCVCVHFVYWLAGINCKLPYEQNQLRLEPGGETLETAKISMLTVKNTVITGTTLIKSGRINWEWPIWAFARAKIKRPKKKNEVAVHWTGSVLGRVFSMLLVKKSSAMAP